jgi:hypothetical protein
VIEDKAKDKEPAEIISEPAGPPSENLALNFLERAF